MIRLSSSSVDVGRPVEEQIFVIGVLLTIFMVWIPGVQSTPNWIPRGPKPFFKTVFINFFVRPNDYFIGMCGILVLVASELDAARVRRG
jgi:hypothetical protein